jgi:2-polyprenyl-3-methyl-5-hydroxy-6-metoxy-1,4-benzoquinol methylase
VDPLSLQDKQDQRPDLVFEFGENWQQFIDKYLDDASFTEAISSLEKFCGKDSLKDKSFLDIGCGSGLFSLAALKLGASSITSIDVDPNSVACTEKLKEKFGNPANWEVKQNSILDDETVAKLGKFDFVYSWGVLHHTGAMWKAIDNSMSLVKPNGYYYIAIYNKSDGFNIYPDYRFGNSYMWYLEKKFYCSLAPAFQKLIDYSVMGLLMFAYAITLQNPIKKIEDHISFRGMNWETDIKDWLGGYPYEYATVQEIFQYVQPKGFELINLISNNGLLNNEFLFKKKD